jgi:hypothetical protein
VATSRHSTATCPPEGEISGLRHHGGALRVSRRRPLRSNQVSVVAGL